MPNDLLVEVLVGLLQAKEDLLGTFERRRARDPVSDASQKLLEQRLQLHVILSRRLRHVYIGLPPQSVSNVSLSLQKMVFPSKNDLPSVWTRSSLYVYHNRVEKVHINVFQSIHPD